ncbi:hypothetical protein PPL_05091 [Heterostelium album PN500]|uniref:Uncharacterized protein n=1 Tax=Heterostelium pallidum (strain ATCC 26659 / Pp 5 / PN500) TaxID=670386 RepID=D3B9E7_HETP5|nr:hypothetical protein PPL_05091 [Heterostelium album PN500]EFA81859.1 hypothetical protein PPL_05091 [Heterostelium album PN500]|eukprot:XP_020433976.1 hypothetical protein PPL_05091 [Heterostelium album PN500]
MNKFEIRKRPSYFFTPSSVSTPKHMNNRKDTKHTSASPITISLSLLQILVIVHKAKKVD